MKTFRGVLHSFAINYHVESKETRNRDIDQALYELAEIVRAEKGKGTALAPFGSGFDKTCDHIADKIEKGV